MLTPYRALLTLPGVRSFVVPSIFGRFPLSMLGLGSVLLIHAQTGSYGVAGAVSATMVIAGAILAPLAGRLADRFGQRRVLLPSLALLTFGVTGLVVTASIPGLIGVVFPFAAIAGASTPQIGSMSRARWTMLVGGTPRLDAALSLESVLDETVFVIGPVLATLLAASVWSAGGVVAALVLALGGGLAFAAARSTEPRPSSYGGGKPGSGAIRVRGVRLLALAFLAVGIAFGTVDLSVVAFAQEHGHKQFAGVLLALVACASLGAGLAYGARRWRISLRRRFLFAMAGLAVGSVPLALAPNVEIMAGAALLAGLSISPSIVTGMALVESLVPNRVVTEGYAWISTALGAGVALGTAVAGPVIDGYGASRAMFTATAAALLALLIGVAGRNRLRAPVPPTAPAERHLASRSV